jgi:predicted nucleotidyltransferase
LNRESHLNQVELQKIVDYIKQILPDMQLIYLFGSRADGSQKPSSDWDVALLGQQKLDNVQRWELAQELALLLNADVDLVDLLSASTVLNMQVVSKGRLLYGDINIKDIFETKVYSMYSRLQESRLDIIEQFLADK